MRRLLLSCMVLGLVCSRPRPRRRPETAHHHLGRYVPPTHRGLHQRNGHRSRVTLSNNEEMISNFGDGGAGYDLAQPSQIASPPWSGTSASTSRSISPRSRSRSFSPRCSIVSAMRPSTQVVCAALPVGTDGLVFNTKHITKETPIADYPDLCRPYLQARHRSACAVPS